MDQVFIDKILLVGSSISLFLAVLLLRKTGKVLHDYVVIVWLMFLGLYVFVYAFVPVHFFEGKSWLINFYIALLFLNGPLLFLYVKAITNRAGKVSKAFLWHLLPFIAFVVYLNIFENVSAVFSGTESAAGTLKIELPVPYFLFLVLLALSVPVYIYLSIRLLVRHMKIIADNFSDIEKRTLTWLRNLTIILGTGWIMLATIVFIHHVLHLFSDSFCINGLFLTLTAFIVTAGSYGFNQTAVFSSQGSMVTEIFEASDKPYASSSLKEEDKQQYLISLIGYIDNKKPYLNNELTLNRLSIDLNIPLHHLSRIINEHFNQNFFDFINQYRVNEFIRRLSDPKYSNYSLLGVAFDCGFNSKTTFNRYFKKATGLTPSQFKNRTLSGVPDYKPVADK
jgi:AraC-like DNA-binding protein